MKIILMMMLLNTDGKVVAQGQADGMEFKTVVACETYKKRMGYNSERGVDTSLVFKCVAKR